MCNHQRLLMPLGKHHSILQASANELYARASAMNCMMSYLGDRRHDSIQLLFIYRREGRRCAENILLPKESRPRCQLQRVRLQPSTLLHLSGKMFLPKLPTHLFKYLLDIAEEAMLRRKWQRPAFAGVLVTGR